MQRQPTRRRAARPRTRITPREAATALATLGALVLFTGIYVVRNASLGLNEVSNAQLRLLVTPLSAIAAVTLAMQPSSAVTLFRRHWALFLLVAYAGVSTLWSVDPAMTTTRSIALAMSAISAIGLTAAWGPTPLAALLCLAMTTGSALSMLAVATGDPAALDTYARMGVRGVFSHKNLLGQCALIGVVLGAGLAMQRATLARVAGCAMFGLNAFALVQSQSVTSVVAAASGIGLLLLFALLRQSWMPPVLRPVTAASVALAAALIYLGRDTLFALLNRHSNLTGRDEIWAYVTAKIDEAPVFGHGYRAYFTESTNAVDVLNVLRLPYDQAHSSIMQTLLDLGGVGLFLLGLWFSLSLWRAAPALFDRARAPWLALALALGVNALTEALVMAPTGFSWLALQIALGAAGARGVMRAAVPRPIRRRAPQETAHAPA